MDHDDYRIVFQKLADAGDAGPAIEPGGEFDIDVSADELDELRELAIAAEEPPLATFTTFAE